MHTSLLPILCLAGCVMVYAPGVPAPGRVLPPDPGEHDLALEIDLARNVAEGVAVSVEGEGSPAEGTPTWPALSIGYRQALTGRVGLDARFMTSLMLPVPFPVPSGLALAPVIEVARPAPTVALHTSPRAVYVQGGMVVAAGDETEGRAHALGLEVPLTASWRPGKVFSAGLTPFVRGFRVTSATDVTPEGETTEEGVPLSFWAWGGGATLDLFVDLGPVRIALGGGIEGAPHPGYPFLAEGETLDRALWFPQGGISLGAAWGGGPQTHQ